MRKGPGRGARYRHTAGENTRHAKGPVRPESYGPFQALAAELPEQVPGLT